MTLEQLPASFVGHSYGDSESDMADYSREFETLVKAMNMNGKGQYRWL